MRYSHRWLGAAVGALALATAATAATAGEPLRRQIDRAIDAKLDSGGSAAAPSTDAEFLRRVYLDLTERIPTSAEARAFLDDPSPYKRERLVDRLLDSPAYAWRMADAFDVMLMERRDDLNVPSAQWRAFLRRAFAENVPYDQLVTQILSADGTDPATRPAAKFTLDRLADPYLLTRDISRVFLGRDIQCAQCHDHPLVDDYKQAHYYGLFAFLNRTSLWPGPATERNNMLAEKAEGDVTFSSVFKKKEKPHATGPRVLDNPPVAEPAVAKGAEYLLAPDKENKVRPIPRVSRRAMLAGQLTSPNVPEFSRNIVNRLWALMMGRGIVHPLDMHHGDNPPSHPELLDLMAKEFVASGHNVKAFLRELALSQTYQRSSEPPPGGSPAESQAEEVPTFGVSAVRPLPAEALGWSVIQAFGYVESYRKRAADRLDGHDPKAQALFRSDPKRQALREALIEQEVHDELGGYVAAFVRQFGSAAGQPPDAVSSTVQQALFLSNGQPIASWLNPAGGTLTARLTALTDPSALAEELYLSLYSRRPTGEERDEVARYLAERGKDRPAAIQELTWALLASTEFRFNH
jgi:hypothetical protein